MASLLAMKTRFQADSVAAKRDLGVEIAEGLRWLWSKPLIRFMAFLTGGMNLANAATPLILIVLAKELGAGDAEIGLIFSIAGMGAIFGSLIGGGLPRRLHLRPGIDATRGDHSGDSHFFYPHTP